MGSNSETTSEEEIIEEVAQQPHALINAMDLPDDPFLACEHSDSE